MLSLDSLKTQIGFTPKPFIEAVDNKSFQSKVDDLKNDALFSFPPAQPTQNFFRSQLARTDALRRHPDTKKRIYRVNDRTAEQALLSVAEKVGFAVSGKHRKAELRDCHIRYENNATTPHVDGPPKELVLHFTLRGAEPEYLTPSDADRLMEPNFDISFTEKDPAAVKAATKTTTPSLVHCFLGQCADAPDFPRLVHWSPRLENEPKGVVGHDERAIFLARFAFQQTEGTKAAKQSWGSNNFRFWA